VKTPTAHSQVDTSLHSSTVSSGQAKTSSVTLWYPKKNEVKARPCFAVNLKLSQYNKSFKSNYDNLNNIEALLDDTKEVGLEVNPQKTKYMLMSRSQKVG
jgi:hypothetical protein